MDAWGREGPPEGRAAPASIRHGEGCTPAACGLRQSGVVRKFGSGVRTGTHGFGSGRGSSARPRSSGDRGGNGGGSSGSRSCSGDRCERQQKLWWRVSHWAFFIWDVWRLMPIAGRYEKQLSKHFARFGRAAHGMWLVGVCSQTHCDAHTAACVYSTTYGTQAVVPGHGGGSWAGRQCAVALVQLHGRDLVPHDKHVCLRVRVYQPHMRNCTVTNSYDLTCAASCAHVVGSSAVSRFSVSVNVACLGLSAPP